MSLAMVAKDAALVRSEVRVDGIELTIFDYFGRWSGQSHQVETFLIESAERFSGPPFVPVDQFQIFTGTDEAREDDNRFAAPLILHYADAYTAYSLPLISDRLLRTFVFRAEATPIAGLLPVEREQGFRQGGRNILVDVGVLRSMRVYGNSGVHVNRLVSEEPDGLRAERMVAESGVSMEIPSSHGTNGQFLFVSKGTIIFGDSEYGIESLGWMSPGEGRQHVRAGNEGAECLVMRFPFPPTRSVRLAS